MPKQRLSKFLASAGVASRRKAEELIQDGQVVVNGVVAQVPQTMVDASDDIRVNGKPVTAERKLYFLLNKPKGYVCSTRPGLRYRSVLDLFRSYPERLFTVGRLDADTTGLLLITNDGAFADRVMHPRNEVQKEYVAKLYQEPFAQHLERIQAGAMVEGSFVKPLRVKKVRGSTVKITVTDGRKREVRVLCRAAGLTVHSLQRIRLGNLLLGKLPVGCARPLSLRECESILQST